MSSMDSKTKSLLLLFSLVVQLKVLKHEILLLLFLSLISHTLALVPIHLNLLLNFYFLNLNQSLLKFGYQYLENLHLILCKDSLSK